MVSSSVELEGCLYAFKGENMFKFAKKKVARTASKIKQAALKQAVDLHVLGSDRLVK
jgi:hypothetical protein